MYERIENLGLDFVCNFICYLLELRLVRANESEQTEWWRSIATHDFLYVLRSFHYCLGYRSCYKRKPNK
mgnify:CR=1 FL=1